MVNFNKLFAKLSLNVQTILTVYYVINVQLNFWLITLVILLWISLTVIDESNFILIVKSWIYLLVSYSFVSIVVFIILSFSFTPMFIFCALMSLSYMCYAIDKLKRMI